VANIRTNILTVIMALLSFIPVGLWVYLGQFTRMMSDDYCTIAIGQALGAWDGMRYWLESWSGSYTNFFLKSLIAPLDTLVPSFSSIVIVLLWLASLYILIIQLLPQRMKFGVRFALTILISNLIVVSALNAMYTPQSFFWHAASPYMIPIIVLTLYIALCLPWIRRTYLTATSWGIIVFINSLPIISSGSAEVMTAFQLAFFTLLLALVALFLESKYRRHALIIFGIGWLMSLISLLLQLLSPGIQSRLATEAQNIDRPVSGIVNIIRETIHLTFQYVGHLEAFAGFILLLCLTLIVTWVVYQPDVTDNKSTTSLSLSRGFISVWILVLVVFTPILWGHTSNSSQLLGRYSYGYGIVIGLHGFLLLIGVASWLTLGRLNHHLQTSKRTRQLLVFAVVALVAICFGLTQVRSIHYRAATFLFTVVLLLLFGFAYHLQHISTGTVTKRFYAVLACHIFVIILIASIVFTGLYGRGLITERILAPAAYLLVCLGAIWGVYLGRLWRETHPPDDPNALTPVGMAGVALTACVITVGIVLGRASFIPDLQTYAQDWDTRHTEVLSQIDAGEMDIVVAPLPFDLAEQINITTLATDPANRCARRYYNVESITVVDDS